MLISLQARIWAPISLNPENPVPCTHTASASQWPSWPQKLGPGMLKLRGRGTHNPPLCSPITSYPGSNLPHPGIWSPGAEGDFAHLQAQHPAPAQLCRYWLNSTA